MTYVYNSQLDAFTLYHVVREEESPKSIIGPALPALGHATSGALGTAVSKLITYPLDLLITRLQVQRTFQSNDKDAEYDGILDAIEKIYSKEGGIGAFYSGVIPETIKGVADSFLFFLAYTYARQRRLATQGTSRLSTLDEIGVGVLAGAFAKFWTTPLQNIVTRKQAAAMIAARDSTSSISPALSTKDIALQIRNEKGLQGFWSGYSASLILTLNPSITFLLQGVYTRLLVPHSRRSDPGARITFLIAAISKAMASTLTYPFSLAKTRAQISSQKPSERKGPMSETEKPGESVVEEKALHARQRTVISTIIRIAKTEGVSALYQGLGAEILKAFFSHGITMLAKERIHTVVINLYYLVLRSLKKYPSPEELGKLASEQAKGAYTAASDQAKEAYTTASTQARDAYSAASEQAMDAYAKGAEMAGDAASKAQDAIDTGRQQASDLLEKGKDVARNNTSAAQDALSNGTQQAGEAFEKGKDAASNAASTVRDAAAKGQDAVSNGTQQAGDLLEKGKDAASEASKQAKESFIKADVKDIDGKD